ncbi:MAG: 3-oxoadipyl-CoA thiolase [Burkholderiaceae bacterium]|nr:3-oxoadipyl-CoA thiolase [Burkholderiaceae bacterium]
MTDAFLIDGVRSPFGRHAGVLASIRPDELVAQTIATLLARHSGVAERVEEVVLGCTNQAGEDSRNVARFAALLAGLPERVGGVTVNRLCASGLQSAVDTARAVRADEGELYVAGGVESMTRAPFALAKNAQPFGREAQIFDTTIGARFPNPRFVAKFGADTMPQTGDNVAREFGVSRAEADAIAYRSQSRYERARAEGFFKGEIVAVNVPGAKGATVQVEADEHPRPDTTPETLAKLKPLAPDGVVTAGNASGINDGAVALLIGSRRAAEALGTKPLARIVASAAAGVPPRIMGVGPAYAIPKALERAGLGLADIDVIEINEAFASQVGACLRLIKLPLDDARVNPNGGAIAVGHPLGASGARVLLTCARELQRRGGRYGVASLCVGLGQGLAVVIERVA